MLNKVLATVIIFASSMAEGAIEMPGLPPVQATITIPSPPAVAAKSYILVEAYSGTILSENEADTKVEPASLTKMMTVYVADQAIKAKKLNLDDLILVSPKAWKSEGSRMFLDVNSKIALGNILRGIIVQSGNDASVALAEHIGGSEEGFAQMMNLYAKQLGMNNTNFVNATGLPHPNHYTSARDMSLLARALIKEFPETYKLYSEKEFTFNGIKQHNRNRLLWRNDLVDGIKTGHTDSAGFCLVASGKYQDMRLIAVVTGTESDEARSSEANKLLNYGFHFYDSKKLYPANTVLQTARIWKGSSKMVELGALDDIYVTFGKGQYEKLKATIEINKVIEAPVKVGDQLGIIKVDLDNKLIAQYPVVALQEVAKGGFFSTAYDNLAMALNKLLERFK